MTGCLPAQLSLDLTSIPTVSHGPGAFDPSSDGREGLVVNARQEGDVGGAVRLPSLLLHKIGGALFSLLRLGRFLQSRRQQLLRRINDEIEMLFYVGS